MADDKHVCRELMITRGNVDPSKDGRHWIGGGTCMCGRMYSVALRIVDHPSRSFPVAIPFAKVPTDG